MKKSLMYLFAALGLFTTSLLFAEAQKAKVRIENLKNGSTVSEFAVVSGTVSDSQADIAVVVHPTFKGSTDYWVQQFASVNDDGTWEATQVHFGQGSLGVGEKFEIQAFVVAKGTLRKGQVLNDWPNAEARTNLITVTRN